MLCDCPFIIVRQIVTVMYQSSIGHIFTWYIFAGQSSQNLNFGNQWNSHELAFPVSHIHMIGSQMNEKCSVTTPLSLFDKFQLKFNFNSPRDWDFCKRMKDFPIQISPWEQVSHSILLCWPTWFESDFKVLSH